MKTQIGNCLIPCSYIYIADPFCRAVKGTGLRPLGCWNRGFGSYRGYGYSSVVLVGFCVGSSLCDELISRCEESYRLCVFPIVCDLDTSRMRPTWPDLGCCTKEKKSTYRRRIHISFIFRLIPDKCKIRCIIVTPLKKQLCFGVEHNCPIWRAWFGTT
jgi:hypothetical protein